MLNIGKKIIREAKVYSIEITQVQMQKRVKQTYQRKGLENY